MPSEPTFVVKGGISNRVVSNCNSITVNAVYGSISCRYQARNTTFVRYNVTIKLADRWKTNTIGVTDEAINVDDIIETTNHFRAVDYIIQENNGKLTETYIKQLHFILKFRYI